MFLNVRHIEDILKDVSKFEKVSLKKGILNFAVNHEEHINKQLRSISKNGSLTEQQYKKIKAVGSNPGILYGLCKVHKTVVDVCLPFRPILSAIGTPTYKLAKYLVPKLASITANEFSVKDSFCFAEEIVNQNSNFIMGSLDLFLFEIAHYGKSLISVFQKTFTRINESFISAGRLAIRLSFYGI